MSNIVEFECIPTICTYNSEDFKAYGVNVDISKYPEIKLNKYNNVSISGNFHELGIGIMYQVKAEEVNNKYGVGYKVLNIKRDKPQTLESSRTFLSEIITPRQVDSILNAYPDIIEKVIKNDLDDIDLNKTPHIKDVIFGVIKRKIIENFALIELVDYFRGYLDISVIKKLHEKYPSLQKIKNELKHDPYKCLCGLSRLAFKTSDNILLDLDKVSKDLIQQGEEPIIDFEFDLKTSKQRAKACIMFCLEENEGSGHTKMDIMELRSACKKLAPACIDHFVNVIKNDKHIYLDENKKFVALNSTYQTESYIANRIRDGLKVNEIWNFDLEKYKNSGLTDEQFSVLNKICNHNMVILNGNAGSGKTYTTQTVLKMLNDNKKSYLLFSPTGRAAKVLSNYCNYEAFTIHRGLGYMPPDNWTYNEKMPLTCDVLIVDEFSMVDIFIMKKLLEAINFNRTKILIIGDSAQITSVGCGNILHDFINSKMIPLVTLTKIFRYGVGGIMTVATKTRESQKFLANTGKVEVFGEDKGYTFIPTTQETMVNKVSALYQKLLSENNRPEDILVLSSMNKGEYGSLKINQNLQRLANSKAMMTNGLTIGEVTFYKDDLVIQTVNNYKAKIYNKDEDEWGCDINEEDKITFIPNGEIGKVIDITDKEIIIEFDGKLIVYDKPSATQLKLAYSISLFKSQGGQAKIIFVLTPKAHTFMLNSNLIYVGQTRAQLKCYHFGDAETVNRAIKKKENFNRNTFLNELLIKIN